MLGGGGFDPQRDIEAIIVKRWPHGYGHIPLFDAITYRSGAGCCLSRLFSG